MMSLVPTMPCFHRRPQAVLQFLILLCSLRSMSCSERTRSKFKAAVYEHAVTLPDDPKVKVTRYEALSRMELNLHQYSIQAQEAKRQGADILVFPEDGLYGFMLTWETQTPYLEVIPDPAIIHWTPCNDPLRFNDTEVQVALSCMAKNNNLYLVANMGDKQPCTDQCSTRSHLQFNTNVAFDPSGKLVARYHKKHLFYEDQFDTPATAEKAVFDTPFGRWAMFTCFDILFERPAVAVMEEEGVANIAFPTAWMDALPLLASVQFHAAFARGMGINLLAANVHWPARRFQGSGVYTSAGAAAFYHNATVSSAPRLVVAELDILDRPRPQWQRQAGEERRKRESQTRLGEILKKGTIWKKEVEASRKKGENLKKRQNVKQEGEPQRKRREVHEELTTSESPDTSDARFVAPLFHDAFSFIQLVQPRGALKTCSNNVCCHLNYSLTPSQHDLDLFALGAFDGFHTYEGTYYLQICALVRCANQSQSSCGQPTNHSSTLFRSLSMRGEFETSHVFPEVLLSTGAGQLALAEAESWRLSSAWGLKSEEGFPQPLLSAALFGRVYSRDGPLTGASRAGQVFLAPCWLLLLCAILPFIAH